MTPSLPALNALNFFMADVRDGLGPFLGVFLQDQGWAPGAIGLAMTLGGLAGVVATTPLGALVDATRAKRALVAIAAMAVIFACATNYLLPRMGVVVPTQMIAAIAAAAIGPALAGITLGLVGQAGFPHQLGRNEAWNHAGNATAAVLSGLLGWWLGIGAVFALMAAMAIASLIALAAIPARAINHEAARGAVGAPVPLRSLLASRPLLLLAGTLLLFHLANAAMLPLLGQAMVARGTAGDPSAYTAATVIVAQGAMIPMALLAAWMAERRGYRLVFILALLALPLRGALAGLVPHPAILLPVQLLDGVGAGLLGVAVPGLAARLLQGTGRINAGLGLVLTAQGIGAAFSALLGGMVAEALGYHAAFWVLGGVALAALLLWLAGGRILREAGA
ncbi:MFS transporter [Sediminicoccus sp. KRV36]|uniref:MFS transporter n=1 Tax=Sediminicoccus sp. KRV36 TaxID=3133721 RepID=UPI00200D12EC|nr:MFS transporter [Sediminicoccus rosea]UPY37550.1 MFS transporter [Sediminicoccus rosea]